jgi:hypothetical protein
LWLTSQIIAQGFELVHWLFTFDSSFAMNDSTRCLKSQAFEQGERAAWIAVGARWSVHR